MTFVDQLQTSLGPGYQLDRELMGGGMSRVFVAQDRALGRRVVVKVLTPELAAGVNRDRFRREIQLAAQLQHPHIVPVLAAGEDAELLWYTMPFIEGESLRTALERQQEFSVRDVIRVLHDIVDALAYAHARGIVHRDIKPANILSQGAHALVTDFGVAKALSAAMPHTGLTAGGTAIGTPAYMAPEQLAGDPSVDARADLFAVGLLAYELLTGRAPFAAASPRETMTAQLTIDPAPLDGVRGDVPRALAAIVSRCLAKDPAARPESAAVVLRALEDITISGAHPSATAAAASRRRSRNGGVVALLGAAVIVWSGAYAASWFTGKHGLSATPPDSPAAAVRPAAGDTFITLSEDQLRALIASEVDRKAREMATAMKSADSATRARIADSVEASIRDSLDRARIRTLAMSERRVHVLTMSPTSGPTGPVTRDLADSLRRRIDRRPAYALVPTDTTLLVSARRGGGGGGGGRGRGPDSSAARMAGLMGRAMESLRQGDLGVAVTMRSGRGSDSTRFVVTVYDSTSFRTPGQFLPVVTVEGRNTTRASADESVRDVINRTMRVLDSLAPPSFRGGGRRGGRPGGPPPPPGGPGTGSRTGIGRGG